MNAQTATYTIVEEITIQAPAERVFAALTQPEEVVRWWQSPEQFEMKDFERDLREGGRWLMSGTRTAGGGFTIRGEYREIEPPRRLVTTWLPDWYENASESLVRWDLEERDGITTVRLTHSGLPTEAGRASHRGWPSILRRLQAYAEGGRGPR